MSFTEETLGEVLKQHTNEFCMNLVVTALQAKLANKQSGEGNADSGPYQYIPSVHEIHIFGLDEDGEFAVFLIMDRMADGTLEEYFNRVQKPRGPCCAFEDKDSLKFLQALLRSYDQLLQGYFFIHEIARISHNDIKPGNLAAPLKELSSGGATARSLFFDFGLSYWSWDDQTPAMGSLGYFDPSGLFLSWIDPHGSLRHLEGLDRYKYRSDEWSMGTAFLGPMAWSVTSGIIDKAVEAREQAHEQAKETKPEGGWLRPPVDSKLQCEAHAKIASDVETPTAILENSLQLNVGRWLQTSGGPQINWLLEALFSLTRKWGIQCSREKRGRTVEWRLGLRRLRLWLEVYSRTLAGQSAPSPIPQRRVLRWFAAMWERVSKLAAQLVPRSDGALAFMYTQLNEIEAERPRILLYGPDEHFFPEDANQWENAFKTKEKAEQRASSFLEPADLSGFPSAKWLEEVTVDHLIASSERTNSTQPSLTPRAYFAAKRADIYSAGSELLAVWYFDKALADFEHVSSRGDRGASHRSGKGGVTIDTPSSTGGPDAYSASVRGLQGLDPLGDEVTLVNLEQIEEAGEKTSLRDALAVRLGRFITEALSDGVALVHFRLGLDSLEQISPTNLQAWTSPTSGGATAFHLLGRDFDYAGYNKTTISGAMRSGDALDAYRPHARADSFSLSRGIHKSLARRGFQILQRFDTNQSRSCLYSALIASASDWYAATSYYREYESLFNRGGRLDDTRQLLHSLAGWQYASGIAASDVLEGGWLQRLSAVLLVEAPDWALALHFYHQFHTRARDLLVEPLMGATSTAGSAWGLAPNSTVLVTAVARMSKSAAKLRDFLQVRLDLPQRRSSSPPMSASLKARIGIFSALIGSAPTDVIAIFYYMEGRLELAATANSTAESGLQTIPGSMLLSARTLLLDSLAEALSARAWSNAHDKGDVQKAECFAATVLRVAPDEHSAAAYRRKYVKRVSTELSHRADEILRSAVDNQKAERVRNQMAYPNVTADELPVLLLSSYLLSEKGRAEKASADHDEDDLSE
ncbi:unnamed protein product [Amoebophrya sp. A25]|nr:unnamed protein product [Amoebophrya sp. A25]|eukprot:GSA25T00004356001.1